MNAFEANESQIVSLLKEQNKINKRIKQILFAALFFGIFAYAKQDINNFIKNLEPQRFRIQFYEKS